METVFRLALIVVGIVNAYPVVAAFAPRMIQNLYGITIEDHNLLILLRHRAVLLGLLGGFMIVAAFDAALYLYAVIAGLLSMLTYIVIAQVTGGYNDKIRRVVYIDVVAAVVLALAYVLYRVSR